MEAESPGAAGGSRPWFQVPCLCGFLRDSRSEGHSEATLWTTTVAIIFSKRGPRDGATDLRGLRRVF